MPSNEFVHAPLMVYIAQRCQRAYVHELRNSLQGIYTGFDVLARLTADNPALTRAREVTRNAIASHEKGMQQMLLHLIQPAEDRATIALNGALNEIRSFLNNDAAARDVSLRAQPSNGLQVSARPLRLRTALLGVTAYFIDTLRKGEIILSSLDDGTGARIEVIAKGPPADMDPTQQWLLKALTDFVASEQGVLEMDFAQGDDRKVRLSYRA